MKRRAFTITELIAAMVVLALVVAATIPIVRKKMEKVSYSQYWMGYNTTVEIAKNLSGDDCVFKFDDGADNSLCLYDNDGANFCNYIKDKFNTAEYNCALGNATDSSDFTNPHITLSNGLRLFIGSGFKELFPDAESENDKTGYKIYVDINGSKGKGILWEDVFPFYILKSGKVLAGYPSDAEIGGNNNEYLSVNVLYDDFSSGKRVVKILQSNMNYRQAMCATGMIKSATYCGGITVLPVCNNLESDCRLKVKSPIKIF